MLLEAVAMVQKPNYISFLIRLWRDDGESVAEVEQIPDGKRKFFPSIEGLLAHIRALDEEMRGRSQRRHRGSERDTS